MRIRSIKPEFWTDEKVGEWDAETRLAYIWTWSAADDYGRLRISPALLRAGAFPYHEMTLERAREILATITRSSRIELYEVDGETFGQVVSWEKHQKVDKPGKFQNPAPDRGVPLDSRECRESVARVSRECRLVSGSGSGSGSGWEHGSGEEQDLLPPLEALAPTLPKPKSFQNPVKIQAVTGDSRECRESVARVSRECRLVTGSGSGSGSGWEHGSGEEQDLSPPLEALAPTLPKPKSSKSKRTDKPFLDMDDSWEWKNITETYRKAWSEDFPGINLDDELRKARAWVRAAPAKRRKKDWVKFLAGTWFKNAQDRGGSSARGYPSLKGKAENEWQSVLEAAKTGSDIAMGIVEGNIHERTRYALRQFDRNPIQAMKEIGMVRQDYQLEIKHRQFIAAWVAFEDKAE